MRAHERERDQAVAAEDYERASTLKAQIEGRREELDESRAGGRERAAEVLAEDVAEVVSRATGIPVSQLTAGGARAAARLEEQIHERVVGQDEAVEAVARAVRRARAGLGDPNRPVGSFLFLGPTGVGKTELARALAETLFGDEDAMVRFDMSEFQERHTVSRLVGAPPGYVGYEEAGQLTEPVRRRPYSVLLLDEIEKAHPDVFNILLQLLDDGRLTDGQGRTVDFRHTVVIMTSNLGADRIQAHARRNESFEELKDELMDMLRQSFRPELLNRIDEIIVFRSLDRDQLMQITRLLLDRVARRMRAQRVELEVSDEAVQYLANAGFDPQYGARPLRQSHPAAGRGRALAAWFSAGSVNAGDRVVVDALEGELHFDVRPGGAAKSRRGGRATRSGRELMRSTRHARRHRGAEARADVPPELAEQLAEDLGRRHPSVDWRTELVVDRLVEPPPASPRSSRTRAAACSGATGTSRSSSPTCRSGTAASRSRGARVGHTASPSCRFRRSGRCTSARGCGARSSSSSTGCSGGVDREAERRPA